MSCVNICVYVYVCARALQMMDVSVAKYGSLEAAVRFQDEREETLANRVLGQPGKYLDGPQLGTGVPKGVGDNIQEPTSPAIAQFLAQEHRSTQTAGGASLSMSPSPAERRSARSASSPAKAAA